MITDGEHVYMVCYPTLNGLIVTDKESNTKFLSYPIYRKMRRYEKENK